MEPGESDLIDVLSGSSLKTFLRCPQQWEYAYVYRFRRPPALRMVMGTAGHRAAEVHMLGKLVSREDGPLDVALDAFSDTYDEEAKEAFEEPAKNNTVPKIKDKGIASVKFWHKSVAPLIQPLEIERPISFNVNGIPWTGTLDLVDEDLIVRDWKFTGRTPRNADAYLLSMVGYAIGYRVETGGVEQGISVDHIVGLKTPTYVPIKSDGPVPDAAIIAFTQTVENANRQIQAGLFPPNGLVSGACTWCGYRDICPAYKDQPVTRGNNEEVDEE